MALAVIAGGGFGANVLVKNNNDDRSLTVMVAYADDFLKVKSATKQTLVNGVYFAPADDVQKNKEQLAKAQKDYNEITAEVGELGENETANWRGVGKYDIYDEKGNVTGKLYTSSAGYFVADKDDYKNVKSFTVENESADGYLHFEWSGTYDLLEKETENSNEANPYSDLINHKFTLSGDELRKSQAEIGGYGYMLWWLPAMAVFDDYGVNYSNGYDATYIKDKITFTFEYEDGTTQSASINISFDSYGHMQIS